MSELNELIPALVEAQSEFGAIPKTAKNTFFNNRYVTLATLMQTVLPILSKHGLAISQFPSYYPVDGSPALTTYLLHESGQYLSHAMPLLAAKTDPQGQGSAITYARRYSFMAVLGLVADEDDDGNAASPVAAAPKKKRGYMQGDVGLEDAKVKLREAIKSSGADPAEYYWVKNATMDDTDRIFGLAEALSSGKVVKENA